MLLPELPAAAPLGDAVLLGCDDRVFPFRQHVAIHLAAATNPLLVLEPGPAGSVDEVLLYYGTVIRIGDSSQAPSWPGAIWTLTGDDSGRV